MKTKLMLKTILGLIIFGSIFTACQPKTVSDETIGSIIAVINQADSIRKLDRKNIDTANAIIGAELAKYDLSQLSLKQIDSIGGKGVLYRYNVLRKAFLPALTRHSSEPTLDGCRAAATLTVNFPIAEESEDKNAKMYEWAEAYKKFATHPSIEEFMITDGAYNNSVFGRLQFLDSKVVVESGLLETILPLLSKPMTVPCGASAIMVFTVAKEQKAVLSHEKIQEIRALVLAKTKETLAQISQSEKSTKRYATHLEHLIAFLNGPASRGTLIGNIAPEIHFTHTLGCAAKTLSELKGNVIILDFWATWCSPCIASFPNIRALQERYKNYPVKIIGVTSLQGYHSDPIKRTRTKATPEEEYKLMGDFMIALDMTWAVAFSEESNFNPEFGVRGIPHVAIIDADGNVRFNNLRPYNAPFHEAEKIDNLLKEAGLPFPKEPMEEVNYAKLN